MKKNNGFTLIESLIVLAMIGMIMTTVYAMIMHYRDVSGFEQAKVRQTQENRFIYTAFFNEVSNAGCLATNARSYAVASGLIDPQNATQYIFFNGIYPLNNTAWPDGLILAAGDPDCMGKVNHEMTPSTSAAVILEAQPNPMPWQVGDQAMMLGLNGYYVFRVAGWDPGTLTLTMAAPAIYYSGLLNTANYLDNAVAIKGVTGRDASYPVSCMVARVSTFSIYLIQERPDPIKGHNIRELVRVTDTAEIADVLGSNSPLLKKGIITQNIWDMQVVYKSYPNFPAPDNPDYFFTSEASQIPSYSNLNMLLTQMDLKRVKDVTINLITLTDDYPGKGEFTRQIRPFADRTVNQTLPTGKFTHRGFSITVYPKNFGIKL